MLSSRGLKPTSPRTRACINTQHSHILIHNNIVKSTSPLLPLNPPALCCTSSYNEREHLITILFRQICLSTDVRNSQNVIVSDTVLFLKVLFPPQLMPSKRAQHYTPFKSLYSHCSLPLSQPAAPFPSYPEGPFVRTCSCGGKPSACQILACPPTPLTQKSSSRFNLSAPAVP